MRHLFLLAILGGGGLPGQDLSKYVLSPVGYGYSLISGPLAPGQLFTIFTTVNGSPGLIGVRAPAGADLPTALAGLSVGMIPLPESAPPALPVLEVDTFCSSPTGAPPPAGYICETVNLAAITVQAPFEIATAGVLSVNTAVRGEQINFGPALDQAHILTYCDQYITASSNLPLLAARAAPFNAGLPCPSVVTHADGSLVSATSPATAGEELVAYGVGLGQTTPPLQTGKLVTAAAPTQTTYLLDFNFHPNALPSKPVPGSPKPIYAGATPGYVGLYQINFVVPPIPAGTPSCYIPAGPPPLAPPYPNVVVSNLTVSVGGLSSFDGARICVAVPTQ